MNSRIRLVLIVLPSAASLAGCMSGGPTQFQHQSQYSSQSLFQTSPYLLDRQRVIIDSAYVDRYACANGAPLYCQRTSRLASSTAYCACP